MLLIHTASNLEAKPLIEHYQLKRNLNFQHFELYQNKNQLSLIISGIGKLAAATAVSSALSFLEFNQQITEDSRLLNFGLAGGSNEIEVKSIWLINQVKDFASNKNYYPEILFKSSINQKTLITFDQAVNSEEHPNLQNTLVDMEMSAVFFAANKWLTSDRIHSVKVVADHLSCEEFKRNQPALIISDSLSKATPLIDQFLSSFSLTSKESIEDSSEFQKLAIDLRLSQSQKQQLIKAIKQYETCCNQKFNDFIKLFHYQVSEHKSINAKTFMKLTTKLNIEAAKSNEGQSPC